MPDQPAPIDAPGASGSAPLMLLVFGFGLIGGLTAYGIDYFNLGGTFDTLRAGLSMLLGGVLSLVFVFLIANTDRADKIRLATLALVGGIFWPAVVDVASSFVTVNQQVAASRASLQQSIDQVSKIESVPTDERAKVIDQLQADINKAAQVRDMTPRLSRRLILDQELSAAVSTAKANLSAAEASRIEQLAGRNSP